MDEQRCELPKPIEKSKSTEDMLDMVERVQGDRMNEQRSDLPADDDPSLISTYYMSGRDIILGNLSSDDGDVKENGEKNNRSRLAKPQLCTYITRFCTFRGPRDDAVVRALASHQSGPGSNPGVDAICGLSLLLVLSFAPRGFSPGISVFPSPQKTAFSNSNSTRNQVDKEPLCGCATSKSLFNFV